MRFFLIRGLPERIRQLQRLWTRIITWVKQIPSQIRTLPRRTWQRLVWSIHPRRRKVRVLADQLQSLPGAPGPIEVLRQDVYRKCLLEIKDHELRVELSLILKSAHRPTGAEQIFMMAIYPVLLHRRLVAIPQNSPEKRLDVEIGYRGHSDEYYFWAFEIDGEAREHTNRIPTPRTRSREDRVYLVYPIPAAGLVDNKVWNAETTILHMRSYFVNILEDLKRRGYQLLTAQPQSREVLTYSQRKLANSRITSPFQPKRSSWRR